MSASIVKKELIDILVTALVDKSNQLPKTGQRTLIGGMSASEEAKLRQWCNEVGAKLWAVNYDSYNNRYDEQNQTPEYTFEPDHRAPAEVLAAVVLYQAQIWESTTPRLHEACETLYRLYVPKLPVVEEARTKLRTLA